MGDWVFVMLDVAREQLIGWLVLDFVVQEFSGVLILLVSGRLDGVEVG